MTCRVVLADPNVTQREGIRRLLEQDGFEIIAETGNGEDALRIALRWRPDVVLLGLNLPDGCGTDITRHLLGADPSQHVVLLGSGVDDSTVDAAVQAGAHGVLTTDCTLRDVADALRRAADGDVVLAAGLTPSTRRAPRSDGRRATDSDGTRVSAITAREQEVLQAIVDGLSCREAAARLYMSHRTLKNHLCAVYPKLQAHDRTQAILTAVRLGIVRLG